MIRSLVLFVLLFYGAWPLASAEAPAGARGMILDRNGEPLARSVGEWKLNFTPTPETATEDGARTAIAALTGTIGHHPNLLPSGLGPLQPGSGPRTVLLALAEKDAEAVHAAK